MFRLVLAACLASLAHPALAQTVYVLTSDNTFGKFDLTGSNALSFQEVSTGLPGTGYYGLTSDRAGGFYAVGNTDPTNPFSFQSLVYVSASGAAGSQVEIKDSLGSRMNSLFALAGSPGGTLYAYDYGSDRVGTLNPTTGVFNTVRASGIVQNNAYGFLAFAGGELFSANDTDLPDPPGGSAGNLSRVNLDTGSFGPPINGSPNCEFKGMVLFGVGADLYGIKTTTRGEEQVDVVFRIDTMTGTVADFGVLTGRDQSSLIFAAAELVPVPEPTAGLGLAAAGYGLARWVRRRRVVTTA